MNELILSLDTTHEFGSLALVCGDKTIDEVLLHSTEGFGHILFGHLSQLLERHSISLNQVECFAAASGPGSFTGVRVGLACVKGLAEATGKRIVTVSNLEALAFFGAGPVRAVVLDARRGEVYGAVYDAAGTPLGPEVVMRFSEWLEKLPAGDVEFISTDFAPFHSALRGTKFEDARTVAAPRALAAAIGHIAVRRFRCGMSLDPAEADANYVRRSDAELMWREGGD